MNEATPIYLDTDDDITTIIGKFAEDNSKRVALVIPKRSSILQSAVNLKLVQKKAKDIGKEPILITEDSKTLNLAATLGILAAPSLKATPKVPQAVEPKSTNVPSDVIEGQPDEAAQAPAAAATATASEKAPSKLQQAKSKPRKVPNFDLFKKRFFWVGLGIIAVIFGIWAVLIWLPKATIAIQAQTEPLRGQHTFTADTGAENADNNNGVLPATSEEITKTHSKNFNATGKKDVGTKAKGSISIKNCEDSNSHTLGEGTKFTSSSGKSFITDAAITVPAGLFAGGGSICNSETVNINVTAAANGDSYNIGATSYTTSALSGNFVINGSEMTGGVSKIVSVVTKKDLENAQKELLEAERDSAKEELAKKFNEDDFVIDGSLEEEILQSTSDPEVGTEVNGSPTITLRVTYTQLGVKRNQLEDLIKHLARNQARELGKSQLGVADAMLDAAKFSIKDKPSNSATRLVFEGDVLLGPDIDFEELKLRAAGKKYSEVVAIVKSYPNVIDGDVEFSPFWVRRVPGNPEKVTVEIRLPEQ